MASLDTSLVRRELQAIASGSQRVKALLYAVLERLENDPSQFEELEEVSPQILASFSDVTLRKIKIQHQRHSFRLIVAHWTWADGSEHVDVLYAFSRKAGYAIDWEWVDSVLRDET